MNYTLPYSEWLKLFSNPAQAILLEKFQAGLEREALRVNDQGRLASTPHPASLGSSLTHPGITTDFAEAQLELITPPFASIDQLLDHQMGLHAFVARRLPAEEGMWFQSMPPPVTDAEIQIAHFGHSHSGRIKEIYRRGLAKRYGKKMQIISGIHFNYSFHPSFWDFLYSQVHTRMPFSVFISENYLGLMRNYLRHCWLLSYLFGASPLLHPSFLERDIPELQALDAHTLLSPQATSLRMSRLGYVNSNRCTYFINYNSLTEYLAGLYKAISTPCPSFQALGLIKDGEYQQLNDHILQIENEHYALIRPKQPPHPGERPLNALRSRGIAYVEIRALDINPFEPLGVSANQLDFIRLFLLWCLLEPNPPIGSAELELINENQHWVAFQGRQPGMKLLRPGGSILLQDWGKAIFSALEPLAALLDQLRAQPHYLPLLAQEAQKLTHPELTPSAQVITHLQASGFSYLDWMLALCTQHLAQLRTWPLEPAFEAALSAEVEQSLRLQAHMEAQSTGSFTAALEEFLRLKSEGLLQEA